MTTRHRYITVAVSLIISIGLALPICCHAGVTEKPVGPNHQQTTLQQAQTQQHYSSNCLCGHQLRKEVVKKSNDFSQSLQHSPLSANISSEPVFVNILQLRPIQFFRIVYGNQANPPLYLLNSVFLN